MKKIKTVLLIALAIGLIAIIGCKKSNQTPNIADEPIAINSLLTELTNIEKIQDSALQAKRITKLWDTLASVKRIPWIQNDTIVFLHKSTATSVHIVGDMTSWSIKSDYQCKKIGTSSSWYLIKNYPTNARLDYKIVENNSNWKLDPMNPKRQLSGFGYNSAFAMSAYDSSKYLKQRPNIAKGNLSEAKIISSAKLSRNVRYWVYMPADYENLSNLPSVYVLDGQEYKTEGMGSMVTVLDNLIADNLIEPVLTVFVDPVNPSTGTNQRVELFLNNPNYAAFFKDELVPFIDKTYKTENNSAKRLILGTSYGGNCATYFGYLIPDVFKLIAPQSPAFNSNVISLYSQSNILNISKVFITTGVINDTETHANSLEQLLKTRQIEYNYVKVNEGHSWGNWSALLDDMLRYFFKK